MKYFLTIVSFSVMLSCFSQENEKAFSKGESHFVLGLMGAFPISNFGDDDLNNEDALFAQPGFGFHFTYCEKLSGSPLFFHANLEGFYHQTEIFAKSTERSNEELDQNLNVIKNPYFLTIPVSVGIGVEAAVVKDLDLYAKLNGGFSAIKMTEVSIVDPGVGRSSLKSSFGMAFTFGAEVGIMIGDKFMLGVQYLLIPDSKYEFDVNGRSTFRSATTDIETINIKLGAILGR